MLLCGSELILADTFYCSFGRHYNWNYVTYNVYIVSFGT